MPALSAGAPVALANVLAKVAKTPADAQEKARQSAASLHVANAYQFIIAGIVSLLLLRSLALRGRTFFGRARLSQSGGEKGSSDAFPAASRPQSFPYRVLGRIDVLGSTPIGFRFISADCTVFRLLMSTLICTLNVAFCLVISSNLTTVSSPNSNILRSFSRRCGRMAAANFPIMFALAGRNNIISLLTGFAYTEVRFYHKLLGAVVTLEAVVHTLSYASCYLVNLGWEVLYEEYEEIYFKMGICAVVFMVTMSLTGLHAFRHRYYEIFLILHVSGAAVILAGAWYHRPIMEPWVYAAAAIWAFERASRLVRHVGTIFHRRVILRAPLLTGEAKVVHGAIVLSVPFAGTWSASQHCYISFWSPALLARPWLFGQSHPFSIINVQSSRKTGDQSIELVLRIKKGLTRELADHIESRTTASGSETCTLAVMAEGPYGQSAETPDAQTVLLLAGGSGITFVASALEDVVQKIEAGQSSTNDVRLVWAIHHLNQVQWLGDRLDSIRVRADKVGLKLKLDLYVTRLGESGSSSEAISLSSSEGRDSDDEKKTGLSATGDVVGSCGAAVHHGRPEVAEIMHVTVSSSLDRTCIIACGPESLADVVRTTAQELASASLKVNIARYQC